MTAPSQSRSIIVLNDDSPEAEERAKRSAEAVASSLEAGKERAVSSVGGRANRWYRVLFEGYPDKDELLNDVRSVDREGHTLDDLFRIDNQKFLQTLEEVHGVRSPPKMIGYGFQGQVWQLPDGNVMKTITQDADDSYDRAVEDMKKQRAGDPTADSRLRVFGAFKLLVRRHTSAAARRSQLPLTPPPTDVGMVAVIMEKIVPGEKHGIIKQLLDDILLAVSRQVSLACVPFAVEGEREEIRRNLLAARSPEVIRDDRKGRMINVSYLKNAREYAGHGWKTSVMLDINVPDALAHVSSMFLSSIDDVIRQDPRATRAIRALPVYVRRETGITLRAGDPNWWDNLKAAIASEIRRGGWDIVSDNFGINSKGDIIPFDM